MDRGGRNRKTWVDVGYLLIGDNIYKEVPHNYINFLSFYCL
jgi:hypothetical protein